MVKYLMEMLNAIKIYHWNTHSYSQHKATDELHERLSTNIDRFVEVLLGKVEPERIRLASAQKIPLHNYRSASQLKHSIYKFRSFLVRLDGCFTNADSDLLNIRDEILADLNQFIYLLTLS